MSEKNEQKLCPYHHVSGRAYVVDGTAGETSFIANGFGDCLQEKCAMWRVEVVPAKIHRESASGYHIDKYYIGDPLYDQGHIVVDEPEKETSYCGLAGDKQ